MSKLFKGNGEQPKIDFCIYTHVESVADISKVLGNNRKGLQKLLLDILGGVLVVFVLPAESWRRLVSFVSKIPEEDLSKELAYFEEELSPKQKIEYEYLKTISEECKEVVDSFLQLNTNFSNTVDLVGKKGPISYIIERLKIISPLSLLPVLSRIRSRNLDNFQYWLQQSSFNFPLLADSFLRIRNSGLQVPILRYDFDVLFSSLSLKDNMLTIKHATFASIKYYKGLLRNTVTQTFAFSSKYNHQALVVDADDNSSDDDLKSFNVATKFLPWSQAFSTEATPALLATEDLCSSPQFTVSIGCLPSTEEMDAGVRVELLERFYGIQFARRTVRDNALGSSVRGSKIRQMPSETLIAENPTVSLNKEGDCDKLGNGFLGSNPVVATNAGCAFCISTGISMDVPPLSNFRMNVLWSSDDLFVRLAKKIKCPVLDQPEVLNELNSISYKFPVKERGLPRNIAVHTLERYLPAFVSGCILDSWITSGEFGYSEKFLADLSANTDDSVQAVEEAEESREENVEIEDGTLVKAAKEVLESGRGLSREKIGELRAELKKRALDRIKEVYFQLRDLYEMKDGVRTDTFASLWVSGKVASNKHLGKFCEGNKEALDKSILENRILRLGKGMVSPTWHEKVSGVRNLENLSPPTEGDLNPHFADLVLHQLVEDGLNYLDWIHKWPAVVQAVRAGKESSCPLDLVYIHKK